MFGRSSCTAKLCASPLQTLQERDLAEHPRAQAMRERIDRVLEQM